MIRIEAERVIDKKAELQKSRMLKKQERVPGGRKRIILFLLFKQKILLF